MEGNRPKQAVLLDRDAAARSLDDLFIGICRYRACDKYQSLLDCISRFPRVAPFNAMLIHIQKPGATYVLPPSKWMLEFGRVIKPNARPIVILQTMRPVQFVFDVTDTEGGDALPPEICAPFEAKSGTIGAQLEVLIRNCPRDGIRVSMESRGSQSAGVIVASSTRGLTVQFQPLISRPPMQILVRYELVINESLSREARFATLVHELAHLYCGHLGTPDDRWWPDRQDIDKPAREFEAESVAHLVCTRAGVDAGSHECLSGYLKHGAEVPDISLDRVVASASLIEGMCKKRMKLRK